MRRPAAPVVLLDGLWVLLCATRRIGLHDTEFAKATCGTIRLKLLKIGALVRVSVRRIKIAMASACPATKTGAKQQSGSPPLQRPAPRRPDTRRRGVTIARHNQQAHGDLAKHELQTAPFGATNLRGSRPATTKIG